MAKVEILVLKGCPRCKALKNKLDYIKNSFKFVDCDDFPEICDYAEQLSGSDQYPIAIVLDIQDKITDVVYFTDDYNQIGKRHKLLDGVSGFTVYSVDQLAEYIIKS